MIKRLVTYNAIAVLLGIVLCLLHGYILKMTHQQLLFSLVGIYSFFTIASVIIISGLLLLSETMPTSVGYAFLVGIFLKMGIFVMLFFAGGMAEKSLNMTEKISILIPLIVFMGLETSTVIKRLKF